MIVSNFSDSGYAKKSMFRLPAGACAGSNSIATQPGKQLENAPSPQEGSKTRPSFLRKASMALTTLRGVNTWPKVSTSYDVSEVCLELVKDIGSKFD